jgi:hypothetical protein
LPSANLPGVSPAYNELFPGWVLSDNIFFVMRNASKYRKRNKAKRVAIKYDIFRSEIMEIMIEARNRLREVSESKEYYTEKDISGAGKNYLTETARQKGVETYTWFLKYYALTVFMSQLLGETRDESDYKTANMIMSTELTSVTEKEKIELFVAMDKTVADSVLKCKQRSSRSRIIDDYRGPSAADKGHSSWICLRLLARGQLWNKMSTFIPSSECYSRICDSSRTSAKSLDAFVFDGEQLYYTGTIQTALLYRLQVNHFFCQT